MKWVRRKLPTHLGSLPPKHLSEMVYHLYSDDDMTENLELQLCRQHNLLEPATTKI